MKKPFFIFLSLIIVSFCKEPFSSPDHIESQLKSAKMSFANGEDSIAYSIYTKIIPEIKDTSQLTEICFIMGKIHENNGNADSAYHYYGKPRFSLLNDFLKHKELILKGKECGIEELKDFEKSAYYPILLNQAAEKNKESENYAEALKLYSTLIDLPTRIFSKDSLEIKIANLYEKNGEKDKAGKIYKKIILKKPYHSFFRYANDKVRLLDIPLELNTKEKKDRIRTYARYGQYTRAIQLLKKYRRWIPKDFYSFYKGYCYYKLKKYRYSRNNFRFLLRNYPRSSYRSSSLKHLFMIYWNSGNTRKMNECIRLLPKSSVYKSELIYYRFFDKISDSNIKEAEKHLKRLTRYPKNKYLFEAYFKFAITLIAENKLDKARLYLDRSLKTAKTEYENQKVLFFLGYLLHQQGDKNKSSEYFQKAYDIFPGNYYGIQILTHFVHLIKPANKNYEMLKPQDVDKENYKRYLFFKKIHFDKEALVHIEHLSRHSKSDYFSILLIKEMTNNNNYHEAIRKARKFDSTIREYGTNLPDYLIQSYYLKGYQEVIDSFSNENQVPNSLIYSIIWQESQYNPQALSSANARGLMQLLPGTAKRMDSGKTYKQILKKLHEPEYNIKLGTKYIKNSLNRFQGELPYVIASYNAGISKAKDWRKKYGELPPILAIEKFPYYETRLYTKIVLKNLFYYNLSN